MPKMKNRKSKITALFISVVMLFQIMSLENVIALTRSDQTVYILSEISELRDEFSNQYELSDGQIMAVVHSNPINFEKDGRWETIDNTLIDDNDIIRTENEVFNVEFAGQADSEKLVRVKSGNHEISWSLTADKPQEDEIRTESVELHPSAAEITTRQITEITPENRIRADEIKSMPTKSLSSLRYENALEDIDIEFTLSSYRLKEDIIIRERSDILSYTVDLTTNGLIAALNEDNSVNLIDTDGKTVFVIETPYMFDSNMEFSYNVKIELTESENGYIMVLTPDADWLNDDDRAYPVTLDPTVFANDSTSNLRDVSVYTDSYSNTESNPYLWLGKSGSYRENTYLKFNKMPNIVFSSITYAELNMEIFYYNGNPIFNAHEVISDWPTGFMTWTNRPSRSSTVLSIADTDGNVRVTRFDLTEVVKKWYNASHQNRGVVIETRADVDNFFNLYSSETNLGPVLSITYNHSNALPTGWLDVVAPSGAHGWAWNPAMPNHAIDIRVRIRRPNIPDVLWENIVTANRYRPDLYNAGYGNGHHGFLVEIPWESLPREQLQVTVTAFSPNGDPLLHGCPKVYDNKVNKRTYTNSNSNANSQYSRTIARNYAYTFAEWTDPNGQYDTPFYLKTGASNCTNFVSGALYVGGGMDYAQYDSNRTQDTAWWYNDILGTIYYATYTWGGAPNFARHWGRDYDGNGLQRGYQTIIYESPQEVLKDWTFITNNINEGDVIQVTRPGELSVSHAMIVHDVTDTNPKDVLFAQHTGPARNVSLREKLQSDWSGRKIIFHRIKNG